MAVKLYNQTRWPDRLLRDLLHHAARRVGACSDIAVKVTTTWRGAYANAPKASSVSHRVLCDAERRRIYTDGGWIRLRLMPWCGTEDGAVDEAKRVLHVIYHEWAHIRDYQNGETEWSERGANGQLPHWSERPEELRAEETADRLMDEPTPRALALIDEVARFLQTDPRVP